MRVDQSRGQGGADGRAEGGRECRRDRGGGGAEVRLHLSYFLFSFHFLFKSSLSL